MGAVESDEVEAGGLRESLVIFISPIFFSFGLSGSSSLFLDLLLGNGELLSTTRFEFTDLSDMLDSTELWRDLKPSWCFRESSSADRLEISVLQS